MPIFLFFPSKTEGCCVFVRQGPHSVLRPSPDLERQNAMPRINLNLTGSRMVSF
jgi:hypothetical protein